MSLEKTDAWWLLTSGIGILSLIFMILKWDFSKINPIAHIKAIYIILLLFTYLIVIYVILNLNKKRKRRKDGKRPR